MSSKPCLHPCAWFPTSSSLSPSLSMANSLSVTTIPKPFQSSVMATTSLASTLTPSSFCQSSTVNRGKSTKSSFLKFKPNNGGGGGFSTIKALTLDFSGSFFEGGMGEEDSSNAATLTEEKEEIQCPPGLKQYETMAVLRPDMSEDERLALTQKYEELVIAGGGMYVEIFNRGVIPLAYSIKKKNKAGETNTYLDGIYLLFTYFTKPDSMALLETRMKTDDNIIRSSSFKIRKRKY